MKRQCISSFDRISVLPSNITETILMFLSLRDMVRTSVLSRSWRYRWAKVPQLLFEEHTQVFRSQKEKDNDTHNLNIVFGVLLQHEGPIWKFTLDMFSWFNYSEIDKIIHLLSRRGIRELKICSSQDESYTLPSSIFHCVELKHLTLTKFKFNPLTFDGFSKLITFQLYDVALDSHVSISSCPLLETLRMGIYTCVDHLSIDAPNLKTLDLNGSISYIGIMNTPLLKDLSLSVDGCHDTESTFDLTKLLCNLPLLENLLLHCMFLQLLAVSVSPNKCSTVLHNLRKLELIEVAVNDKEQLASTLWLLRNSPNLKKLNFKYPGASTPQFKICFKMQDYPDYYLMKLQEVKIILDPFPSPGQLKPTKEFLKFLLVISPELEKFCIETYGRRDLDMLLELACHRRASSKAEIVLKSL